MSFMMLDEYKRFKDSQYPYPFELVTFNIETIYQTTDNIYVKGESYFD